MARRTWQQNAAEFAELDSGEGWPFARLIACSVLKGADNGRPSKNLRDHEGLGKCSAAEFARRADTSADRVLRYLTAWNRAAESGHCSPSTDLSPSDAHEITDPDVSWKQFYSATKAGGRPRDSRADDAVTIVQRRGAEAVVAAMPDQIKAEIARELGKTDVGMDAALEGYAQRPDEKARRLQNKERRAAEADAGEAVYHFSTKIIMAEMLMLEGRIGEVVTEGDGRDFVWTEQGASEAIMVAAALRSLADRLEAWGKQDARDPWDRGLAELLGTEGDVA